MNRTKRRYLRQARLRRNLYFPFRGKGSYSENLSRKKKKKKNFLRGNLDRYLYHPLRDKRTYQLKAHKN